MNDLDVLINSVPLSFYGGAALLNYSVGETVMDNQVFRGVNRTSWAMLKSFFGMRELTLTVIFSGETLHDAKLKRSRLNFAVHAESEIFIPDDGFFYSAICKNLGAEEIVGQGDATAQIKATYTFEAIRHGAPVSETVPVGGSFFCYSTMPFTDCRLTLTVGTTAASYSLAGATFPAVTAGDVLVFDGILKKILKNGTSVAATASWINFPALVPGENTITAIDPVTVEYSPAFI